MIKIPKGFNPSNELSRELFFEQMSDEIRNYHIHQIQYNVSLAYYIYYRIQWGITHFGYKPHMVVQRLLDILPLKASHKSMMRYYKVADLLNYIKIKNSSLHRRLLTALNTDKITWVELTNIACLFNITLSEKTIKVIEKIEPK